MSNANIEDLQVKVAFLEDALSKLSDEYYQQQRELDTLKKQTALLSNRVNGLQDGGDESSDPQDERPPHY